MYIVEIDSINIIIHHTSHNRLRHLMSTIAMFISMQLCPRLFHENVPNKYFLKNDYVIKNK